MRVTINIAVDSIHASKALPLNPKTLLFAINMLRGHLFPPIKVERRAGHFLLRGGRHRLAAHKLLGRKNILAHYGVVEDPRPDKPLVHKPEIGVKHNIPQADGYSLSEAEAPAYAVKRKTWLEE